MKASKHLRSNSAAFKAQVLAECAAPGASIAAVALAHGLNANLVHRWRAKAATASVPQAPIQLQANGFIPVPFGSFATSGIDDIRIALKRSAVTVKVCCPMADAVTCGRWLREVLL